MISLFCTLKNLFFHEEHPEVSRLRNSVQTISKMWQKQRDDYEKLERSHTKITHENQALRDQIRMLQEELDNHVNKKRRMKRVSNARNV
jgi:predicted  nucleic acid-binding Zn-ribbon protein